MLYVATTFYEVVEAEVVNCIPEHVTTRRRKVTGVQLRNPADVGTLIPKIDVLLSVNRFAENVIRPQISHACADRKRYMESPKFHLRLAQLLHSYGWIHLRPIIYNHGL